MSAPDSNIDSQRLSRRRPIYNFNRNVRRKFAAND
jgi:hypothetical protein